MMKKLLFLLCLLVAPVYGQVIQTPSPIPGTITSIATFTTASSNSSCFSLVGSGIQFHQFEWTVVGTVSAGGVKLQKSAASDCSSPSDLIAAQVVTSSGITGITTDAAVNYFRFNVSTGITGTGTVYLRYYGYVNTPSGISGSTSTVRDTPAMTGFTTDYDSGMTTLTNVDAALSATTTLVQQVYCNNTTAGAITVTIKDNQGTPKEYVSTFSIPANSNLTLAWPVGLQFTSGIRWNASANTSMNCQIRGKT